MLRRTVAFIAVFVFLLSASAVSAEEKDGMLKRWNDFKNKIFAKKEIAPAKQEVKPAAAKAAPAKTTPPQIPPPPKAYTKEEQIAKIREILDRDEEVMNFIPGLKKVTPEKGEPFYTYEGKKLEDVDPVVLSKVFSRIRSEAVRVRTDRLNRQLENIRRNEQLTSTGGAGPRVPGTPPQPPRTYAAPQVPPAPPQTTRTPAPPPAPPRR